MHDNQEVNGCHKEPLVKNLITKTEIEQSLARSQSMLALLNDFRKFDWAEEYKYPTVVLAQMNQLLAECRDDQPVVAP